MDMTTYLACFFTLYKTFHFNRVYLLTIEKKSGDIINYIKYTKPDKVIHNLIHCKCCDASHGSSSELKRQGEPLSTQLTAFKFMKAVSCVLSGSPCLFDHNIQSDQNTSFANDYHLCYVQQQRQQSSPV